MRRGRNDGGGSLAARGICARPSTKLPGVVVLIRVCVTLTERAPDADHVFISIFLFSHRLLGRVAIGSHHVVGRFSSHFRHRPALLPFHHLLLMSTYCLSYPRRPYHALMALSRYRLLLAYDSYGLSFCHTGTLPLCSSTESSAKCHVSASQLHTPSRKLFRSRPIYPL